MRRRAAHVLNFSGGKDSTAMWLLALDRGVKNLRPVAADTGHEHPITYEYWDYLEQRLGPLLRVRADFRERIARKREYVREKWPEKGVPQTVIDRALEVLHPTGIPFLDLCLWKSRFPSTKARFCTEFLKIVPIQEQVYLPLLAAGHSIISWQGVRAQESAARARLSVRERRSRQLWYYRPLLKWTVEDVFAMHRKHGVKPNPLYQLGMSRVGCMPCINANKSELQEIAKRFPEEIARVAEWERLVQTVSKRQGASFFSTQKTPGDHRHDTTLPTPDIYEVVEWSRTSRGGMQYPLLEQESDPLACSSVYGLCE